LITLIIPKPQKTELLEGKFILDNNVAIYSPVDSIFLVDYFLEILKNKYNLKLEVITAPREKKVILLNSEFNHKDENEEDYSIDITSEQVKLTGLSLNGLFYAFQSLRQIIEVKDNELFIPAQKSFY